ncbi:MAG: hypothetical protein ACYDCK_03285 [Thermoplasmatota archaeon]
MTDAATLAEFALAATSVLLLLALAARFLGAEQARLSARQLYTHYGRLRVAMLFFVAGIVVAAESDALRWLAPAAAIANPATWMMVTGYALALVGIVLLHACMFAKQELST